jgi:hypothetical protein
LHLVYQPFEADQAKGIVERLSALLENHGFTVKEALVEELTTATAVCAVAVKGSS